MLAPKPPADTIVALSSGRPPAAIAVIRTSGPLAFAAARTLAGDLPAPRQFGLRTLRSPSDGEVLDKALVVCFGEGTSATGEAVVEYHCHGGRAVADGVCRTLVTIEGMRDAVPGEFTRRALANGRIDLTEAEGLADLLRAETEAQRRVAQQSAGGALSRQIEVWQERVVALSARAEALLDFVDEDDEQAHTSTAGLREGVSTLVAEWREWLGRPRTETMRDGVRVVVAGPPNAGKSSLVNALAGTEKAIVTEIAGTTRDVIEVPLAIDGLPIVLVDTAGLRVANDAVEAIGVGRARDQIDNAEILLWLGEPADAPAHPRRLIIASKGDLLTSHAVSDCDLVVSSVTGLNMAKVTDAIAAHCIDIFPQEGEMVLNHRQSLALRDAADALSDLPADEVLLADCLRSACLCFDQLTGRAGVDDMLDSVFSQFCLGK